MILRKPYAFLIKHFRLFHALLTALLIFIVYNTNKVYSFFVSYIKNSNNLRIYIEPSITSISLSIYFAILLSVIVFLIVGSLMKRKDKPYKYYMFSIIFYSLLLILFFLSNASIMSLIQNRADLQLTRIIRDLLGLFYFLQYIFIIISLIRATGFNIKNFDFQSDLKELKVLDEDNEEFELEIELDSNDVKTKFRRNIRILKYAILENKKILLILLALGIIFSSAYVILDITIYNKVYNEKELFKYGELNLKVLNSYETSMSYSNVDISERNKYIYYVVKMEMNNPTNINLSINMSNIELDVSGIKTYSVDTKSYSYFKDIGNGYSDTKILANSTNNYIFVFKVEKEFRNNSKILKFIKSIKNTSNGEEFVYLKVDLNPQNLDNYTIIESGNLKDTLNINSEFLGKVKLTINDFQILNNATYQYKETINNKEYSFTGVINPSYNDYYGKKILKLNALIEVSESYNDNMLKKFLGNFAQIRYKKDSKEYINPFDSIEVSPDKSNEFKYLEIYDEIDSSDEIYLDIIIRDQKYIYKLA